MGNDILHGSLFGYSKKDVNSYITDLSNQYKLKSEEYDEKLLEVSNENSALKQNIDSLNDEISNIKNDFAVVQAENESIKNSCSFLKEQIEELENKKNELLQMIDNLAIENKSNELEKAHYERLYNETKVVNALKQKVLDENNLKLEEMTIEAYTTKQELCEKDNHIKDLTSQIEDLIQDLQKSKDEYVILLQEKEVSDEKYAQIEDEISDIIEKAQKNAEEIIQDAKEKANDIIDNATTESDVIIAKANNESDRVKSVYKDAAQEYYAELIQYTEEMKYTLTAFMKEVSAKSKDFNDKIDFMRLETENKARTTGIIEDKTPVREVQKQIKTETTNVKKSEVVNKLETKLEELLKKAKDAINNITKRKD